MIVGDQDPDHERSPAAAATGALAAMPAGAPRTSSSSVLPVDGASKTPAEKSSHCQNKQLLTLTASPKRPAESDRMKARNGKNTPGDLFTQSGL
jgi:hypothetical protein